MLTVVVGCHNYIVDASNSKQYSRMINQCFVTTKTLKVVKHEKDRKIIELSPGDSGEGLVQMGALAPGTKIILRQINRQHIVEYGDLYYGIVEFPFQGATLTAEAFSIFLNGVEFSYNPNWLQPCQ